jgi:hypothetical protein
MVACSAQFGVKFTAGFGKVMFASDAAAAASGIDELNGSLQWVEAELSKSEGPFFMGPSFTLVRHTGTLLHRQRRLDTSLMLRRPWQRRIPAGGSLGTAVVQPAAAGKTYIAAVWWRQASSAACVPCVVLAVSSPSSVSAALLDSALGHSVLVRC